MYPPLPVLFRKCAEDYTIPDTNITIEKDTSVMIPILGLHYNEEFFPEPDQFDPDRFNDENVGNIKPYTYLPFGDGPRNCLGNSLQCCNRMDYFCFCYRFKVWYYTKYSRCSSPTQ